MDRQMSELRKNEGLRAEVKRDVFSKLLGKQNLCGRYPRIYVEREDGDFDCLRTDAPADARVVNGALGQIAPRAHLDSLVGTWVFIQEPAS